MKTMTIEESDIVLQPRKVLVVEDEAILRSQLADVLRDARLTVFEAANADAALEILNTDPDIALVFTDVQMPGSMNGLELAHHIRGTFPKVRLIVTSGTARTRELPFVQKPYVYRSVLRKILTALDET